MNMISRYFVSKRQRLYVFVALILVGWICPIQAQTYLGGEVALLSKGIGVTAGSTPAIGAPEQNNCIYKFFGGITDAAAGAAKYAFDGAVHASEATGAAVKNAAKATGAAVKNAAEATGAAVKNAAKATGAAVKNAAEATGAAVKNGVAQVSQAIRFAADTTGQLAVEAKQSALEISTDHIIPRYIAPVVGRSIEAYYAGQVIRYSLMGDKQNANLSSAKMAAVARISRDLVFGFPSLIGDANDLDPDRGLYYTNIVGSCEDADLADLSQKAYEPNASVTINDDNETAIMRNIHDAINSHVRGYDLPLLTVNRTSGMSATLFEITPGQFALAFRGTEPDLRDGATDYVNAMAGSDEQYVEARELAFDVWASIKSLNPEPKLVFTGHSLGGGLAQYAASFFGMKAVTFNAANPSSSLMGGMAQDSGIINYRYQNDPVSALDTITDFKGLTDRHGENRYIAGNVEGVKAHGIDLLFDSLEARCKAWQNQNDDSKSRTVTPPLPPPLPGKNSAPSVFEESQPTEGGAGVR